MCCFSLPIRTVSSTRILVRPLADDRQLLVYGTTVEIMEDVAMTREEVQSIVQTALDRASG